MEKLSHFFFKIHTSIRFLNNNLFTQKLTKPAKEERLQLIQLNSKD